MQNYQPAPGFLKGRVILVTGAGQGIGRVAALSYAQYGATVILLGRNIAKLERVYDEIEALGYPQPVIFSLDFEKATGHDFEQLAGAIGNQLGKLDGILHNAAFFHHLSPLSHQTLEQWLVLMRVNLAAPFALTKSCLPLLKAASQASVIMTSSTAAHEPNAFWGGFAVAKGGLETLVSVWAQEWESEPNLRINAIIPGPVQSPQRAQSHPAEMKNKLPAPEQLMPLYLYLMGQDSDTISGQIIRA